MNEAAEVTDFEETATSEEAVKTKKSPITDEIREAFDAAIAAGKDNDMVKIDLIVAGAKFKQATKIYNELMVEAGLSVSKEEKDEILANACAEVNLDTEDGFNTAVSAVNTAIESTNEKGAAAMVRAYARKHEMECYKKPKSEGSGTRTTFLGDYYNALIENPKMTEEEAHEFIVEHGTKNTVRWEKTHQRARAMANNIAEKYSI